MYVVTTPRFGAYAFLQTVEMMICDMEEQCSHFKTVVSMHKMYIPTHAPNSPIIPILNIVLKGTFYLQIIPLSYQETKTINLSSS